MTTLTPTGAGTATPAAMTAHSTHEPVCLLIPGIDGDLQVVHSRSGQTVIDVQSVHFDVAGQVRHDHSTIRLTYDAVCELRALLDRIAEPVEPRQPALWSDTGSRRATT